MAAEGVYGSYTMRYVHLSCQKIASVYHHHYTFLQPCSILPGDSNEEHLQNGAAEKCLEDR